MTFLTRKELNRRLKEERHKAQREERERAAVNRDLEHVSKRIDEQYLWVDRELRDFRKCIETLQSSVDELKLNSIVEKTTSADEHAETHSNDFINLLVAYLLAGVAEALDGECEQQTQDDNNEDAVQRVSAFHEAVNKLLATIKE